jgi:23S rRNA pseudouridine1911/1915/1917 synthase
MIITATVSENYHNARLDVFLVETLGDDISRSSVQKWIKQGCVFLQEKTITKSGYRVEENDTFSVHIPAKPKMNLDPVDMEIPILWEDDHYLIIHKKPGIATHPGPGDRSMTLVNGLLYQFNKLSQGSSQERPGIIHRLDKPTEGLLVIAKNDKAHALMAKLFQERTIEKTYYAWVLQAPLESVGTIDKPIARHPKERLKMTIRDEGRTSITHYETQKIIHSQKGRKFSLLKLKLETGRTHQIRVHLQSINCPIVGDLLYSRSGANYKKYGMLLLAKSLGFDHPITGEKVYVELEFPDRFVEFEKNCSQIF